MKPQFIQTQKNLSDKIEYHKERIQRYQTALTEENLHKEAMGTLFLKKYQDGITVIKDAQDHFPNQGTSEESKALLRQFKKLLDKDAVLFPGGTTLENFHLFIQQHKSKLYNEVSNAKMSSDRNSDKNISFYNVQLKKINKTLNRLEIKQDKNAAKRGQCSKKLPKLKFKI